MEERMLERILTIGFETGLSLEKRRELIFSDVSLERIFENLQKTPRTEDVSRCIDWLDKGLGNVLFYHEKDFPCYEPVGRNLPYLLFYKGIKPTRHKSVTIVGTRFATEDALQRSFCLGLEAQVNGITVVSGMAQGIDQACIRGALSALTMGFGANPIGVLGCGLEVDYPAMTAHLKQRVIENGGSILSQFSPYEPGFKQNFPNRNLTMAALGQALIVVQAPLKSGSLITSDFALDMGKDVYVAREGSVDCTKNMGGINLIKDGAAVISSLSEIYDIKYKVVRTQKPIKPFARYGEFNYTIIKAEKV